MRQLALRTALALALLLTACRPAPSPEFVVIDAGTGWMDVDGVARLHGADVASPSCAGQTWATYTESCWGGAVRAALAVHGVPYVPGRPIVVSDCTFHGSKP